MYTLKVVTNYHTPLNYHAPKESSSIHKGMPATFTNLGNFRLIVPGAGEVNLIDIGERRITQADFFKGSWGVLISYQGQECEYRYEGGGEVTLTVTDLGLIEIEGKGNFLLTDLPSFTVKKPDTGNVISGNE